jgi:Ca2+-transporting ATPase
VTLIGVVGLLDPPRDEVRAAITSCQEAGIVPVMITGDHPLTARAVARRLGLAAEGHALLTGRQLAALSPAELHDVVEGVRVYARVSPEQKLRIVQALQAHGELVAMTGDGVNDAPALKKADIGVAMGMSGTDAAREASAMVLLDDNFATMVGAVREGRRIYDNIRRFVRYAVTTNSAEVATLFLAPLFGLPVPLIPIQILWMNLITDSLPGLALAAEPAERDVMRRPPRPPGESIFARGLGRHVLWVSALMSALALAAEAGARASGYRSWQTLVFTVLCVSQLGHILAIRSERDSLLRQGFLSNPLLAAAVALTLLLQLAVVYVPFLNRVFHTEPLGPGPLALALGAAVVVFVAVEIEKGIARRRQAAR